MQKMNEVKYAAQQCSGSKKSQNAMEGARLQQIRFFNDLPMFASTDVQLYLQIMINTSTSQKNDEIRWKKVEKVGTNLREFW